MYAYIGTHTYKLSTLFKIVKAHVKNFDVQFFIRI